MGVWLVLCGGAEEGWVLAAGEMLPVEVGVPGVVLRRGGAIKLAALLADACRITSYWSDTPSGCLTQVKLSRVRSVIPTRYR